MRTAICVVALLGLPALCLAQVSPDEQTTLVAHFDTGLDADYSMGSRAASAGPEISLVEGKFGQALASARRGISYEVPGNLSLTRGTIEAWVQPLFMRDEAPSATILTFRTNAEDYMNVNLIGEARLGVALRTGGEDWVWKRVDVDITEWDPTRWRHVTVTWGDGELHFFVDGQEAGTPVLDLKEIAGEADRFTVAAGNMRMDALRISDTIRTPADIADAASPEPRPSEVVFLSDLEASTTGSATTDGLPDRAHLKLPLILNGAVYGRGIGMRGRATFEATLPEGYETLRGAVGVSELSDEDARARFTILGDGKPLLECQPTEPEPFEIDIQGVRKLSLVAEPTAGSATMAVWSEAMLLRPGAMPPRSVARETTEADLAMARLRLQSEAFSFDLPEGSDPFVLYPKDPFDPLDPSVAPGDPWPRGLRVFASRGEVEPTGFLIATGSGVGNVAVSVSDLKSDTARLSADNIDIRWVLRGPQRKGYWMPPANTEITSRFLMPDEPFDLAAGAMREVHLDVSVPADAEPGVYQGAITVSAKDAPDKTIALIMRVLPIDLPETSRRRYGMYYHMANALSDPQRGRLELADMRAHGNTTLFGAGLGFRKDGDAVVPDTEELREALDLMREMDYAGTVPVHDSLITLARMLGHQVGGKENAVVEGLEDDEQLLAIARAAFDEVKAIDAEYPQFRLALTHMDEVFNQSRLPLYIQLAKIVRKTTDLPLYETHHTSPRSKWEQMLTQSDPYIDIRSMNGHALDDWLREGHTFEELAEGAEPGDELWTYYNMRGSFFTPEWCRIVNGYYMWMSPLTVHIPWMYHSFGGDPFDDTDSERYDFGYSVPSPVDGITPVPTLHMKGSREGIDDMRYIELLEDLIAQAKERDPKLAEPAEEWLKLLRGMMPKIPEQIMDIEGESPILIWISENYTDKDYQRMRFGTAEQIMRLQDALK